MPPTTSSQLRSFWPSSAARRPAKSAKPKKRPPKRFDPSKFNAAFERCYKGHVVRADEWDAFMESMRAPLPSTFSFVASGCQEISPTHCKAKFESLVESLGERASAAAGGCSSDGAVCVAAGTFAILRCAVQRDGHVRCFLRVEGVAAPRHVRPLPWFPGRHGFVFEAPRKEIQALRSMCREMRQFLEVHSATGRINRQEAVSMLPPLLLDLFPAADGVCYDRVLCDVPCSGDGTLRKNPDIWGSWQPRFSASLHPLQLAILCRGLDLLGAGGQLVYSTCSLAPCENEAVVAAALRAHPSVELVDTNGTLPGLHTSPGLSEWRVTTSDDGSGIRSFSEASEDVATRWRLSESLFAPPAEEARRMRLDLCVRLMPHANDTGGFFVALLRKGHAPVEARVDAPQAEAPRAEEVEEEAAEAEAETGSPDGYPSLSHEPELVALVESMVEDDDEAAAKPPAKGVAKAASARGVTNASELERGLSFTPMDHSSDLVSELAGFYGLSAGFPWACLLSAYSHMLSRRLYLCSPQGASVLRATKGLRGLAAGVKVFERDDSLGVGCSYRIVQDGALLLLPHLGKRVVYASPREFGALLRARSIELPVGVCPAAGDRQPPAVGPLSGVLTQLEAMAPNGACLVTCDNGCGTARLAAAGMRYTDKMVLFISDGEAVQMASDLHDYFCHPPLREQLSPLSTAELVRRADELEHGGARAPCCPAGHGVQGAATAGASVLEAGSRPISKEEALSAAVAAYTRRGARRELRRRGVPLPPALASALLDELRTVRWPKVSARPGLESERYMVIQNRGAPSVWGTRHPLYALVELCDQLLTWFRASCADPSFTFSAIAVTRNFVGSPHIDTFDTTPQLAVSLGDFEGGQLCVDENGGHEIACYDTRNRIAKIDGRHPHWVSTHRGDDRFSLIFYNTDALQETSPSDERH